MKQAELYDLPEIYDRIIEAGPCEAFYRELARQTGGPVLEGACGTGRLTVPLAADGHRVVGLDTSEPMLRTARAKAAAKGIDVQFVRGDIRNFELSERFALVIVSCNSLAHLTTNEDLRAGLSNVKRHLSPGGLAAFDIVNPDIRTIARQEHTAVRLDLGANPSAGIAVEEIASYYPIQQIRESSWRVYDAATVALKIKPLRLRLIFPQELLLVLEAAGLELMARYGDFAGNTLTASSLNQVCIAHAHVLTGPAS